MPFARILLVALATLFVASANAQLRVCNKTTKPTHVAVAYAAYVAGNTVQWVNVGWFNIAPSQCSQVLTSPLIYPQVKYYAVDSGGSEWFDPAQNGWQTCVRSQPFHDAVTCGYADSRPVRMLSENTDGASNYTLEIRSFQDVVSEFSRMIAEAIVSLEKKSTSQPLSQPPPPPPPPPLPKAATAANAAPQRDSTRSTTPTSRQRAPGEMPCMGGKDTSPECKNINEMVNAALNSAPKAAVSERALYEQACRGGQSAACFNLGLKFYKGEGGVQDKAKARALYEEACRGGQAAGCLNSALMFSQGEGGVQDKAKARALNEQACLKDQAVGCFNAGLIFSSGEGGVQDKPRARALYEQACRGGEAEGCLNLGVMLHQGEGGTQDKVRARALFRQACKMGLNQAC